jgi:hypothetical protein
MWRLTDFFYRHVETLLHRNVTGGCTATTYCPFQPVTRAQMAMFISRAVLGGDPPAAGSGPGGSWDCTDDDNNPNHFTDVQDRDFYCPHVHWMWANGITGGCTATTYCPSDPVNRAQMAIFISRAVLGGDPPAAEAVRAGVGTARTVCRITLRTCRTGCSTVRMCTGCGRTTSRADVRRRPTVRPTP